MILVMKVYLFAVFCGRQFQLLDFSQSNPIKDALYLHNTSLTNNTRQDCSWRAIDDRAVCPDPDVKYILYAGGKREVVDAYQSDWLRSSSFDFNKESVLIVHGYAGGDDSLPIVVLRDGK